MEENDVRKLLASGNPELMQHAISVWAADFVHVPELLAMALAASDPAVLAVALRVGLPFHPQLCAERIVTLLEDPSSVLRSLALDWIVPTMGQPLLEAVLRLLSREQDVMVLSRAVKIAAALGCEPEALAPFLASEDVRTRANTVAAITSLTAQRLAGPSPARTRALLEPLLADPALRVQNEAIKAMVGVVPITELEQMLETRLQAVEPAVRAGTAYYAGMMPLRRKADLLGPLLHDPDPNVVLCVARALCQSQERRCIALVIEAFFAVGTDVATPADARPGTGTAAGAAATESSIETGLARCLALTGGEQLAQSADKRVLDGRSKQEVTEKVLQVAAFMSSIETLTPWIHASLDSHSSSTRRQGLSIALQHLSWMRDDVERLLERSSRSSDPQEKALVALLRWRTGDMSGLFQLEQQLFADDPGDNAAAAEILRREGGVLARSMLQKAAAVGIVAVADENRTGHGMPELFHRMGTTYRAPTIGG